MGIRALDWRKSSYSGNQGGDCVEVADWSRSDRGGGGAHAGTGYGVHVRDSKHPDAGHLTFSAASWNAFLASLDAL